MRAVLLSLTIAFAASGCIFLPPRSDDSSSASSVQVVEQRRDPRFDHSPQELEAFIATETVGHQPVGAPIAGRLESFTPIPVELQRGYCYRMVVRFGSDAVISGHALQGMGFVFHSPGQPQVNGGPGVHGPGAVASAGCPQTDRAAAFDIQAYFGSARDASAIHDLGVGSFTAQLVARPISEAELAQRAADMERQIAEAEAFARAEEAREAQARAEREARWAQERADQRAQARATPSPAAPTGPVSVTIRNRCRDTVRVFYGDDPRFGSGTHSSVGGNSVQSHSFREGDMMWVTDDSRNGLSSVTVSRGTREIQVTDSCTGLTSR